MRVLHFSDIHVGVSFRRMPLRSWPGKRMIGGLNLALFRRKEFRRADEKVEALLEFRAREGIELVLCAGDLTALGTRPEYRHARDLLAPMFEAPAGFLSVPGNHDLYMPEVRRRRRFREFFGDTMPTDRPDLVSDPPWPRVRLIDDDIAVISINSARPNPQPWRSSGYVPDDQPAFEAWLGRPFAHGLEHFELMLHLPVRRG